jgi:hypothetical protein
LLTFGGIPWQVSYIDSFLLLTFGGIPWQVQGILPNVNNRKLSI